MPVRYKATIRSKRRAYALILDTPAKLAVVFVHGFLGNPVKTWLSFQTLADRFSNQYPWWSESDLYFFDYPDFNQAIAFSAQDLRQFLASIYPAPDHSLFETNLTAENSILHLTDPIIRVRQHFPQYEHLILAGHSEGAVVIRRAIEELATQCIQASEEIQSMARALQRQITPSIRQEETFIEIPELTAAASPLGLIGQQNYPILQAQLCLFAPALMGAQPAGLLGILSHKIDALHYSRAYNDLEKGTPLLTNLQRHTEEYANKYGKQLRSLRARVLWGRKEEIVAVDNYLTDHVEPPQERQNHTSVCKPRQDYTVPLAFVRYD